MFICIFFGQEIIIKEIFGPKNQNCLFKMKVYDGLEIKKVFFDISKVFDKV